MHRNAHHGRHRSTELIDEPAFAGGSWSEDYYCRMDERFSAALNRAIAAGKERMPEPPRLRSIARQGGWAPGIVVSVEPGQSRFETRMLREFLRVM